MITFEGCSGDEGDAEKMGDFFGPHQVDQSIRQAVQFCWMSLPKERRTPEELEKQVRRLVDRAAEGLPGGSRGHSGSKSRLNRVLLPTGQAMNGFSSRRPGSCGAEGDGSFGVVPGRLPSRWLMAQSDPNQRAAADVGAVTPAPVAADPGPNTAELHVGGGAVRSGQRICPQWRQEHEAGRPHVSHRARRRKSVRRILAHSPENACPPRT